MELKTTLEAKKSKSPSPVRNTYLKDFVRVTKRRPAINNNGICFFLIIFTNERQRQTIKLSFH